MEKHHQREDSIDENLSLLLARVADFLFTRAIAAALADDTVENDQHRYNKDAGDKTRKQALADGEAGRRGKQDHRDARWDYAAQSTGRRHNGGGVALTVALGFHLGADDASYRGGSSNAAAGDRAEEAAGADTCRSQTAGDLSEHEVGKLHKTRGAAVSHQVAGEDE